MKYLCPVYLVSTIETINSLRKAQTEEENEIMMKARFEYLNAKKYSSEDHFLTAKEAFTHGWLIATKWEELL
jgi:hypothetical protein